MTCNCGCKADRIPCYGWCDSRSVIRRVERAVVVEAELADLCGRIADCEPAAGARLIERRAALRAEAYRLRHDIAVNALLCAHRRAPAGQWLGLAELPPEPTDAERAAERERLVADAIDVQIEAGCIYR